MSRTATKSMKSTPRAAEIARCVAFWQSRSQSEVIEDALVLYYERERQNLAESVEKAHGALTAGPAEALAYLTGETPEGLEDIGMLAPETTASGGTHDLAAELRALDSAALEAGITDDDVLAALDDANDPQ